MAEQQASPREPGEETVISLTNVNKWYGAFHVLKDVNVKVRRGERVVVCGPSGSGKSTMIRCINALEEHQKGQIVVNGVQLTDDIRTVEKIRRDVGMVFQQFNLFPHLTVLENLTLAPVWVKHLPKKEATDTAMEYLRRVKIPEQANKYPGQLSGGQQQRVAVARALASRPEIVFADEPTGNLDSKTGAEILSFLRSAVRDFGQTIVMVTHAPVAASYSDRVVFLADGKVVDELEGPTPEKVLDRLKHFGE